MKIQFNNKKFILYILFAIASDFVVSQTIIHADSSVIVTPISNKFEVGVNFGIGPNFPFKDLSERLEHGSITQVDLVFLYKRCILNFEHIGLDNDLNRSPIDTLNTANHQFGSLYHIGIGSKFDLNNNLYLTPLLNVGFQSFAEFDATSNSVFYTNHYFSYCLAINIGYQFPNIVYNNTSSSRKTLSNGINFKTYAKIAVLPKYGIAQESGFLINLSLNAGIYLYYL